MTAEIPVNNIVVATKTTYINGVSGLPSNRSGSVLSKFDGYVEGQLFMWRIAVYITRSFDIAQEY